MMEMVINGVSTRKISRVTEELCGAEFSKSAVSELCKNLDPVVTAWNHRPLNETTYPFVVVDAMVTKVREDNRVRSRAILMAFGVNKEGYREILGFGVGDSESEASWSEFFADLKRRGLKGVDLVVSDQHTGLVNAIKTRDSLMRLAGAFLMEIDEKWSSGRKYLEMTKYWNWRKESVKKAQKLHVLAVRYAAS